MNLILALPLLGLQSSSAQPASVSHSANHLECCHSGLLRMDPQSRSCRFRGSLCPIDKESPEPEPPRQHIGRPEMLVRDFLPSVSWAARAKVSGVPSSTSPQSARPIPEPRVESPCRYGETLPSRSSRRNRTPGYLSENADGLLARGPGSTKILPHIFRHAYRARREWL